MKRYVGVGLICAAGVAALYLRSPLRAAVPQGFQSFGDSALSSCGQWTADRAAPDAKRRTALRLQWVLGYLTAKSEADWDDLAHGHTQMRKTDEDAITAEIDKYCRSHPLQLFLNSAQDVQYELEH